MADTNTVNMQSPESLVEETGKKLERLRLSRNITQSELAQEAGVSLRTLRRLESGQGVTLDSFVRILAALKLQQNMDMLIPNPRIRPIERVRTGGRERKRARSAKTVGHGTKWRWGNE